MYKLYKLIVSLKYKPEEYVVKITIYDGENGGLLDEKNYSGVKQIVIKSCKEVSISRQLAPDPMVLVVSMEKPKIDFRENKLLYIIGEK